MVNTHMQTNVTIDYGPHQRLQRDLPRLQHIQINLFSKNPN